MHFRSVKLVFASHIPNDTIWHIWMCWLTYWYDLYMYILYKLYYIYMHDWSWLCMYIYIYVWLAAAGGKGTEWTRPASQPGYTTQGTEQIVQQNRRWVVRSHENDALIFDCWMLCPHSCIWPCQSVKKHISQSAHCIVDFENFDVGRVYTRLRTSQRLRQVQGAQPQPHLTWQCLEKKYSAISVITHIG
jgi:hypothetical protein